MTDKTQAEQALIDYVLKGFTGHPQDFPQLTKLIEAVRSESTWPGALSAEECAERYPEVFATLPGNRTHITKAGLAALNRARADGIEYVIDQYASTTERGVVGDFAYWLKCLLPNRGAT